MMKHFKGKIIFTDALMILLFSIGWYTWPSYPYWCEDTIFLAIVIIIEVIVACVLRYAKH